LKVFDTGSGGLSEVLEQVNDGRVLFCLISFSINNTKKFVYIAWCGEGVVGMKKGLFNNHSSDVGFLFKGFHVQINARSEDDLNEQAILDKLRKASGASYDSGAKHQGASELVPTSVAQGRNQATRSNAVGKVADKSDYQKKDESDKFWAQKRQQEDTEKEQQKVAVPPRRTDYNKTSEREQFWAQQKQDQAANPPAPRPTPTPGGASAARNRFEGGQQQQQQPPRSNPPPTKGVSKPPAAAPPPTPAPPPPAEPEPQQEEEQPEPQQFELPPPPQEEVPPPQEQEYYEEPAQEQPQEEQYQEQPYETYQEQPQEEQYQESAQPTETYDEQPQPVSSGGIQARALYDYDAENPDDLSFKEGDTINVIDSSDPSGWWEGEINGVSGFFPSNFCELIS